MSQSAHAIPSVLVVDDMPESLRLLCSILKRGGLEPRPVTSGRKAIEAAVADPPDLILLDIQMPDMSGFEVCRWLKRDERLRSTPVIFISGVQGTEDKLEAFRTGGVDYICKPYQEQEVLARVTSHLKLRQLQTDLVTHNQQLERLVADQVKAVADSQMATIFALAKLAEARDDDIGRHIERVQSFSRLLALKMRDTPCYATQLTTGFIDTLFQTAALHDIGKVGVPDSILLKPARLSPEELSEMKKHTLLGANTLDMVLKRYPDNQFLSMGVAVARSHHEMWDGKGYPDGLKGDDIPLAARIVALADFYDALTSQRCYRAALTHEETRAMIEERVGNHFDPDVAAAFMIQEKTFAFTRRDMHDDH